MKLYKRKGHYWLTDGSPPNRIQAPLHSLWKRHTGEKILPVVNKGEAQTRAAKLFALIHTPASMAEAIPLKKAISGFLDAHRARQIKSSTLDSQKQHLKRLLETSIQTLTDLTPGRITDFLNSLPVSNRTRNRYLSTIRLFCRHLRRSGYLQSDPTLEIERFREVDPRVARFIPRDHYQALIEAAKEPLESIIQLAYWTGRRRGEIFWLWQQGWQPVDLELNLVTLPVGVSKSSRPERFPILREASVIFARLRDQQPKPYHSADVITRGFRRLCRRLGLEYRFHDLRVTFSTRLREAGVPSTEIMALMGHSTPGLAERSYTYHEIKILREALEKISD